jgi:predicted chitinase
MGFNYRYCGFENVQDFVKSMCVSEKKHLDALVGYCKGRHLEDAMKSKDWDVIATKYNGTANAENDYVSGLKRHYADLISERNDKLKLAVDD